APRLSGAALGHPQVRLLLGVAAARAGQAERALGFIRGLDGPRVAAGSQLLAGRMATARAVQRRPQEEELARLLAGGAAAEAEALARELLQRWPESEAARAAHRAFDQQRRVEEAGRLLARAEEELSRGKLAAARECLGRIDGRAGHADEIERLRARL